MREKNDKKYPRTNMNFGLSAAKSRMANKGKCFQTQANQPYTLKHKI